MNDLSCAIDQTVACVADEGLSDWLSQAAGALAVTTYQAGKVCLVGWNGQQVTMLMRHFEKPMGLAVQGPRLALACRHELTLFANSPALAHEYLEDEAGRYDALYLPRASFHTGDLNLHDAGFGDSGLWLAATRFSCLAALSTDFSFVPQWTPNFISQVAPEDRCHLNGLALRDGRPAFVTAFGATDIAGGWRENKATGGIVIDVDSGEIVCRGLSMPHSPRWHDGRLWVLNSGTGELGTIDLARAEFAPVCSLPGYLRGLCFAGGYALVGLSQIREQHIFGGLPIQERCAKLLCAVALIDLKDGRVEGMFEFTAGCRELYDVQFLPGVVRPNILNLQRAATRQAITAPGFAYWLRPSAEIPVD